MVKALAAVGNAPAVFGAGTISHGYRNPFASDTGFDGEGGARVMPDLGKYADAVLSSYAASLILLGLFVLLTIRRGRQARRALEAVERERKRNG